MNDYDEIEISKQQELERTRLLQNEFLYIKNLLYQIESILNMKSTNEQKLILLSDLKKQNDALSDMKKRNSFRNFSKSSYSGLLRKLGNQG
jgi:hypothetical protein